MWSKLQGLGADMNPDWTLTFSPKPKPIYRVRLGLIATHFGKYSLVIILSPSLRATRFPQLCNKS